MNLARLRTADKLTALYGVVLLVVMSVFDWYTPSGEGQNAWGAFAVTDVTLAVTAIGAILVAVVTAIRPRPAWPVAVSVVTATVAFFALLILLYRIFNEPGPDDRVGVAAGAWIGWLVLAALFVAVTWALRDERTPGLEPAPPTQVMPAPGRGQAPVES